MEKLIITSECEKCIYSIINESNKAKITVRCTRREKEYLWGQCIPCEGMVLKNERR